MQHPISWILSFGHTRNCPLSMTFKMGDIQSMDKRIFLLLISCICAKQLMIMLCPATLVKSCIIIEQSWQVVFQFVFEFLYEFICRITNRHI